MGWLLSVHLLLTMLLSPSKNNNIGCTMSNSNRNNSLPPLRCIDLAGTFSPDTVVKSCDSPEPYDRFEMSVIFNQYARYFSFKANSKNQDDFYSERRLKTAANMAIAFNQMAKSLSSLTSASDELSLLYLFYSTISPLETCDMKSFADFKKSFDAHDEFITYIFYSLPRLRDNLDTEFKISNNDISRFSSLLQESQSNVDALTIGRNSFNFSQRLDLTGSLTNQLNDISAILGLPDKMTIPILLKSFEAFVHNFNTRFNSINASSATMVLEHIDLSGVKEKYYSHPEGLYFQEEFKGGDNSGLYTVGLYSNGSVSNSDDLSLSTIDLSCTSSPDR
jgi:hypothetical protein